MICTYSRFMFDVKRKIHTVCTMHLIAIGIQMYVNDHLEAIINNFIITIQNTIEIEISFNDCHFDFDGAWNKL